MKSKSIKSILSGALRVARGTTLALGAAVMLAVVLGLATTALAANGDNFILGRVNSSTIGSVLIGTVNEPALDIFNHSTGTNATALFLSTNPSNPPMKVNSQAKVTNLNADLVDGKDSTELQPLSASTNALGADDRGRGLISASRLRTGVYIVEFNQNVSNCPRVASLGRELGFSANPNFAGSLESGEATTFNVINSPSKVGVITRDSIGQLADRSFHLVVSC